MEAHAGIRTALRAVLCAPTVVLVFCAVMSGSASAAGPFGPLDVSGLPDLALAASPSGSEVQFGEEGEGVGQMNAPQGVAVDQATGNVYVADSTNNRIDEFKASGEFIRAFGWGVDRAKPEAKLQECTSATGCQQGEKGGGAGEIGTTGVVGQNVEGLAVDDRAGREAVYVLEIKNERVQEFSTEGKFIATWGGKVNKKGGDLCVVAEAGECQQGNAGSGAGEFEAPGEQGAIAIAPTGSVYVGDKGRVQRFSAAGAFESSFTVTPANPIEALSVTSTELICVTINDEAYASLDRDIPTPEVRCYSAAGALEHTILLEEQPKSAGDQMCVELAADESGHLFVDEYVLTSAAEQTVQAITEYGTGLKQLKRFAPPGGESEEGSTQGNGRPPTPGGMALEESSGTASGLLLSFMRQSVVRGERVPGPGPFVEVEEGVPGAPASVATLTARIDPEDLPTEYHFEYGSEPSKETASATLKLKAEGFRAETVSVKLEGLKPATQYHFHLVAKNSEGEVIGEDETFETFPAARIDDLSVTDVSGEAATLNAEINPVGSQTNYRFEYAPEGSGEYATTAPAGVGSGEQDVAVSAHVQGLSSGAAYSYRVVVSNDLGEARREGRLVTQHAAAPLSLLDGRVWEQVSPPQKHSANFEFNASSGPVVAAPDGDALAYYSSRDGTEATPEGEPFAAVTVISRHGTGGWTSRSIDTENAQRAEQPLIGEGSEYIAFSEDVSRAVVENRSDTALSPWTSERTSYLRVEPDCTAPGAPECFVPIVTSMGPFADVAQGVKFGAPATDQDSYIQVSDATPDMARLVFHAEGVEEPLVPGGGAEGLYEWSAGQLAPVSVLPGAAQTPLEGCDPSVGGPAQNENVRNALSPDGSLVVWSENVEPGKPYCQNRLFLRDLTIGETLELDRVQSGASGLGPADPVYRAASVGDQHVFFTDTQALTAGAQAEEGTPDLYEYNLADNELLDISKALGEGERADVRGVVGASEDGSTVYAVAGGVLTDAANQRGEKAVRGQDNLYLLRDESTGWQASFVAVLGEEESDDWGPDDQHSKKLSAEVSPNGRWLAFMSDRSLTGYDNEDVTSGKPGERMDQEVFLYSAAGQSIVCASCNPSGARPHGIFDESRGQSGKGNVLVDVEREWEGHWLAGLLPNAFTAGLGTPALHQPRYLSSGGRLFFDSADALVSQAVNGAEDVYEYEPPANGEVAASDDCTSGSEAFVASVDGCVGLISSGLSPQESGFMDASENGDDVFFTTAASLAPSDTDNAYDVYDAHACGAGWGCPPPLAVSPPCTSTSSCRGAPAPQPSSFGAPASATFTGAGNQAPAAPLVVGKKPAKKKTARCPRGKHRVRGKCVTAKQKPAARRTARGARSVHRVARKGGR